MTDVDGFIECSRCGGTEREEETIDGVCLACAELQSPKGDTVEVPVRALSKLVGMAKSRHPTVCNEEAPRFAYVLEQELDISLD